MYYYEASASLFDIVRLFDQTLRQILEEPNLAVFLGVALFLIIIGIFSWIVRRGKGCNTIPAPLPGYLKKTVLQEKS